MQISGLKFKTKSQTTKLFLGHELNRLAIRLTSSQQCVSQKTPTALGLISCFQLTNTTNL